MVLSVQAGYVTLAPTEARPGLFPIKLRWAARFTCVTLLALADPAQRRLGRHYRFLR
jgi:hypothetical protein